MVERERLTIVVFSGVVGLAEDAFRSEVECLAGAAYFLNEARQSKVALFI
jgi:peroxiredoxin family protein